MFNYLKLLIVPLIVLFSFKCLSSPLAPDTRCPHKLTPLHLKSENWLVAYNGYGTVRFNSSIGGLLMKPFPARSEKKTHAALALSKINFPSNSNFKFWIQYKNIKPLRKPQPNPWEVFWVFINYKSFDPLHKTKNTHYFLAKPNGIEFGRAWNEIDQEFLITLEKPRAKFNLSHQILIEKNEDQIEIFFDNKKVITTLFYDELPQEDGKIGLYTEDAEVLIEKTCYQL